MPIASFSTTAHAQAAENAAPWEPSAKKDMTRPNAGITQKGPVAGS